MDRPYNLQSKIYAWHTMGLVEATTVSYSLCNGLPTKGHLTIYGCKTMDRLLGQGFCGTCTKQDGPPAFLSKTAAPPPLGLLSSFLHGLTAKQSPPMDFSDLTGQTLCSGHYSYGQHSGISKDCVSHFGLSWVLSQLYYYHVGTNHMP